MDSTPADHPASPDASPSSPAKPNPRMDELAASLRRQTRWLTLLSAATAEALNATDRMAVAGWLIRETAQSVEADVFIHLADADTGSDHTFLTLGGIEPDNAIRLWDETLRSETLARLGILAFAHCPLHSPTGQLGSLAFGSRTKNAFAEDEMGFLQTVAHFVAGVAARVHIDREKARDAMLLAGVRESIVVTDRAGVVTYWNDGATRLFQYTAGEMLGRPLIERVPEAGRHDMLRWIETTAKGRAEFEGEWLDWRKDGTRVWVEAHTRLIRHADSASVMSVARDITARKTAEVALASDYNTLERAASASPMVEVLDQIVRSAEAQSSDEMRCAVLIVDETDGHFIPGAAPSLPVPFWRIASRLPVGPEGGSCGLAVRERRRVCVEDFEADSDQSEVRTLALANGIHSCCSNPIFGSDGRIVGTLAMFYDRPHTPAPRDCELIRSATHLAGISIEKHQAEQRLRVALEAEQSARADAEAASKSKDRFLAILSHELRTPLTPVAMAVSAMRRDPELPAHLQDDLRMMQRNIDLESRLIDDLLDFSRAQNGKLRMNPAQTGIHELIDFVVETCAEDLRAKKLTLKIERGASNDRVFGDSGRLQQVWWNLLRNAVNFSGIGQTIRIITSDGANRSVEVRFIDSGAGISSTVLPRLFTAFEQGDASIYPHRGGLGLGLAISQAIVQMHGGRIIAESEGVGRGSQFTVRLPKAEVAEPQNVARPSTPKIAPAVAEPATAERLRLLIVEDHGDTAYVLATLLRAAGHDVETAGNVSAALDLAATQTFDLIVSDIGLPDATGYDLMRQIKSQYGIPGIAMSGYGMESDREQSRQAGFNEHVVKPVGLAQLEQAIRRAASNGGPGSAVKQ